MAFNFLGTIGSVEEFEEFEEFVKAESLNIEKRIDHLYVEKQRFLELLDKFLFADITLRSPFGKSDLPDKDWLKKPRQIPRPLINIPDGLTGEDVNNLKKMFLDSIKAKREKNEFKVKKIRDLICQLDDEMAFLTDEKESYLTRLDLIRSRFSLPQFTEIQESKKVDSDDEKNMRDDFGLIETATTREYMVTAINTVSNSIVFARSAPPIKNGDTFVMKNGKNDGVKTVVRFISSNSIIVAEPLTQETPSQSLVIINKE